MSEKAIEQDLIQEFIIEVESFRVHLPMRLRGLATKVIDQAVAELEKPAVCETCKGSGEIPNPVNAGEGNKWDCPDCKLAPTGQEEFVKEVFDRFPGLKDIVKDDGCKVVNLATCLRDALDIIDRLAAVLRKISSGTYSDIRCIEMAKQALQGQKEED